MLASAAVHGGSRAINVTAVAPASAVEVKREGGAPLGDVAQSFDTCKFLLRVR